MGVGENKKMELLYAFILVAIGGAVGAVLRYAVIQAFGDTDFPWAIFVVNIIGCTVASFVLFNNVDDMTRTLVITGLLGAFTTLSAFTNDTVGMLSDQEYIKATMNILLNVAVCLLGAIAGRYLALTF